MKLRIPDNLERNILLVLLPAMAVLMLAAAFYRHLFPSLPNAPLAAAGGCLTWISSFGMARAAARGLHIRVTVAEAAASEKTKKRLAILADAAFLLFAAFTFIIGCAVLVASARHPESPGHPLVYAALPLGSVVTMIRLVHRLRHAFGEPEA